MSSHFFHLHLPPIRPTSQRWPQLSSSRSLNNHESKPHYPLSRNHNSDAVLYSLPAITPTYVNSSRRCVIVRSSFNFPLISPSDHWGNWTALFSIGAIGSW